MLPFTKLSLVSIAFAASLSITGCAATVTTTTSAPAAQAHPAYLHALSDLRNARFHILWRGGNVVRQWDETLAVQAIDRAIREIKAAAIDDGKNLEDHPPVDAHEPWIGALHKGLAALEAAKHDIEHEEDNPNARGLRDRAIVHINEAIRLTRDGIASLPPG